MQHPDPSQRAVLGWPIRWIASLLLFLLFAAGGVPTNACEASDSGLDRPSDALFAWDDDRGAKDDLRAATHEMLGSKSPSDSEVEEEESDSSPGWAAAFLLPIVAQDLDRARDAHPLRSVEASGRRSGRAPPRV
ncbi:MAG: hypothetical protein R3F35_04005 [Myxococcota bacterium]